MPKPISQKWAINYVQQFNFENFYKVEFNLEFDETTTIWFIMQFFLEIIMILRKLKIWK